MILELVAIGVMAFFIFQLNSKSEDLIAKEKELNKQIQKLEEDLDKKIKAFNEFPKQTKKDRIKGGRKNEFKSLASFNWKFRK